MALCQDSGARSKASDWPVVFPWLRLGATRRAPPFWMRLLTSSMRSPTDSGWPRVSAIAHSLRSSATWQAARSPITASTMLRTRSRKLAACCYAGQSRRRVMQFPGRTHTPRLTPHLARGLTRRRDTSTCACRSAAGGARAEARRLHRPGAQRFSRRPRIRQPRSHGPPRPHSKRWPAQGPFGSAPPTPAGSGLAIVRAALALRWSDSVCCAVGCAGRKRWPWLHPRQ
mmetsp:Transcript_8863/g.26389  ORF Transcript_8863/g.26389 Transcript_8863/m.26389 type:complete len:228 (+) Transcript_8863:249-932(+)